MRNTLAERFGISPAEIDELTESDFRELAQWAGRNPSMSQKIDLMIGLLTTIYNTTATLAGSWVKHYKPPSLKDAMPVWGKRKRKPKRMTKEQIAAVWGSFRKRG